MEHAEALERIEIAAAEPEGLDRLMAGDTPDAAAVAGHLAGCPSCAEELVRIRRTSAIARRRDPRPSRTRRCASGRWPSCARSGGTGRRGAVEAEGTRDGRVAGRAGSPAARQPGRRSRSCRRRPDPRSARPRPFRRPTGAAGLGLLAAAAAVVIAVGVGYAIGGAAQQAELEASADEVAILSDAATTALRIEAQPDAQRVPLAPTPGRRRRDRHPHLLGRVPASWSPWRAGLEPEAGDEEYGCWVEADGERRRLGRMYPGGDVGPGPDPWTASTPLPPGAVFGVSRSADDGTEGEPVLDRRALIGSGRPARPIVAVGLARPTGVGHSPRDLTPAGDGLVVRCRRRAPGAGMSPADDGVG